MRPKPIDQLKTNDAFFEQLRAREQALCPNPYISNPELRQQLYEIIGAEVIASLKSEQTNHGKPTERVTAILNPSTCTMRTELQTLER